MQSGSCHSESRGHSGPEKLHGRYQNSPGQRRLRDCSWAHPQIQIPGHQLLEKQRQRKCQHRGIHRDPRERRAANAESYPEEVRTSLQ